MQVTVINRIDRFEQLKPAWDEIYSADPDTTIFKSWGWIRGWIDTKYSEWSVLAARPDSRSSWVAFMPLGIHRNKNGAVGKLFLGGHAHPGADSTGFVCLPEYAEEAIPTFGRFIQKSLKWDEFFMRGVLDTRLDLFLKCFSGRSFLVQENESNTCPHIILPDTWERYLEDFLGTNTRGKMKYYTRKLEGLAGFRITETHKDNLESNIDTLLTLWQARFGNKHPEVFLDRYRAIFRSCFENDCLWLTLFWHGSIPVAAKAAFLDQKKKDISSYTVAFNDEYAKFRPGNVMTGYAIRYAIENGFRIYDFGHGAEDYKFSFGTTVRFHRNVSILPKTLLGSLKKRIPAKVKKLIKDTYVKNVKGHLT